MAQNIVLEAEMHGNPGGQTLEKFGAHIEQLAEEALLSAGLQPLKATVTPLNVVGITEDEARWAMRKRRPVKLIYFPKEKNVHITCVYPPDGLNPTQVWASNTASGGGISSMFNLTELELP
jgi:hypothetical protein